MARRVYRVCRARYARLDGEGARFAGGRWNSPNGYVCVAAVIPDIVSITTERDLRHRADLRELSPQALGDWWIETKESAVLEVASTVVPDEHNYLLNPAHPEFAQIATEPPALFHFDPRLFR